MNADEIAKSFYQQRNANDFFITKKQAEWLFRVWNKENPNAVWANRGINGQFVVDGISFRWDANTLMHGAARFVVTEVTEKEQEETHPVVQWFAERGYDAQKLMVQNWDKYMKLFQEFAQEQEN